MHDFTSFPFSKEEFGQIKTYEYGTDWPVVYLIENGEELYIGETTNLYNRSRQHIENVERQRLKRIHVISDDDFNKSSALDIESWLIQYMLADGKYKLQNGNAGLQNHNYYQRRHYEDKFEQIWDLVRAKGLARQTLRDLKNSDLFKYSPYKTLNDEQYLVAESITRILESASGQTFLVHGKPGTGKTVLAVYLVKYLLDKEATKHLNIALVVPMASLRKTIKKVFRSIKGLKSSMVIGPGDVIKNQYDLLIVDEAHRLMRRRNITNYKSFDDTNRALGFEQTADQLDWIRASSKYQIYFYDEMQSVKPSDISFDRFTSLDAREFTLTTQMRAEGGEEYVRFIEDLIDSRAPITQSFKEYDFQIFDDVEEMVGAIKNKDQEIGLSRVVAGYAWDWKTKDPQKGFSHDIEIDGARLVWNSEANDWVNSPNAINEVGCIHTVQGYDLNYVGVIVGPEITYDEDADEVRILKENYRDRNGKSGVKDDDVLKRYILNIYKTLLTRGIKGCYVYFVDKKLERYFKERMGA